MEESNKIIITVDGVKYYLDNSTWLKEISYYEKRKYQGVDDDNIESKGYED